MKQLKRLVICLALVSIGPLLFSQSTIIGTNPNGGNIGQRWLGWINNDLPLDLRTNNTIRMRINNDFSTTISGFSVNTSGFMGISDQFNFFQNGGGLGPYSMLHLNGGNDLGVQTFGYRNWMKYGMTITSNQDLMYVGHRAYGMDRTDAVMSWSDNSSDGPFGPDRMRFIFTGNHDPSSGNAKNSLEGKEIMVMYPETGYVGIGNYTPNIIEPTESLDAFETARLRAMPSQAPDVLITGVEQDLEGDYQLNYSSFSTNSCDVLTGDGLWTDFESLLESCADLNLEGGDDCDWAINPGSGDVVTALDLPGGWGNECAAPVEAKVGIGIANPIGKLHVFNDKSAETNTLEVTEWVQMDGSNGGGSLNFGIWSDTYSDGSSVNAAVTGTAKNAKSTRGGDFRAEAGTMFTSSVTFGTRGRGVNNYIGPFNGSKETFGVHGFANSPSINSFSAGVYGEAVGNAVNAHWAGYFNGRTYCAGTIFTTSDEKLKKNIAELENGLDIILALSPKTYEFRNEEFPTLNLSTESQYGLLSQDVEKILPDLVTDMSSPAQRDSLGNVLTEGLKFKGMNYQSLIPILIQATKEQQEIIETQDSEIERLQEQVKSMNTRMDAIEDFLNLQSSFELKDTAPAQDANCVVVPNPFNNETEIRFMTETSGKVTITLLDSNGARISTELDEVLTAGQHTHKLDATHLDSGVYYCLIEINGREIAKRLIKAN